MYYYFSLTYFKIIERTKILEKNKKIKHPWVCIIYINNSVLFNTFIWNFQDRNIIFHSLHIKAFVFLGFTASIYFVGTCIYSSSFLGSIVTFFLKSVTGKVASLLRYRKQCPVSNSHDAQEKVSPLENESWRIIWLKDETKARQCPRAHRTHPATEKEPDGFITLLY